MASFSSKIRKFRFGMGWTQVVAAKKLGVTQSAWSRWENGLSPPKASNRKKILDRMNKIAK